METNSNINPQNLQNLNDFDWPFHEDIFPFDKALKLPPLDINDFDLHSLSSTFHWEDIFLPEDRTAVAVEAMPVRAVIKSSEEDEMSIIREMEEVTRMIERGFPNGNRTSNNNNNNGRRRKLKSSVLELEEIQKHFDIPISEAAKQMNVGLTVLKKRCRQLNILRWPHRKLKSLKSLIQNVKIMGLTNEVNGLEEHKKLVEELPNMDLTYRTKRLRQACFKANYKMKKMSNIIADLH